MKEKIINGPIGEEIVKVISKDYGYHLKTILGSCRKPELVDVRCIIAGVLFRFGYNKTVIGRLLGKKHHTTILNLIERSEKKEYLSILTDKYYNYFLNN